MSEKWDAILAANPVLLEKDFAEKQARWEALRDVGESAGLKGDNLNDFIACGMKNEMRIFTPYANPAYDLGVIDDMGRVELYLSKEDWNKIERGRDWEATVTDLRTGRRFAVAGASCGSPNCFCAAKIVMEVKKTKTTRE